MSEVINEQNTIEVEENTVETYETPIEVENTSKGGSGKIIAGVAAVAGLLAAGIACGSKAYKNRKNKGDDSEESTPKKKTKKRLRWVEEEIPEEVQSEETAEVDETEEVKETEKKTK